MERVERLRARLKLIGEKDASVVFDKDVNYGHSWKKRGGIGAFMVIARKWDRLEERMKRGLMFKSDCGSDKSINQYDLFGHITADSRDEGVIDDVRDLRRYLMLVEEEMVEQGVLNEILNLQEPTKPVPIPLTQGSVSRTEHPRPYGFDPNDDVPRASRPKLPKELS